jgi:hypothetical protein
MDLKLFRENCLILEGKEGTIVMKRKSNHKTHPQNKYYWAVVIPILADHFGYTSAEMHSAIGMYFWTVKDVKIPYVYSTAMDKWTTVQWEK